MWKTFSQHWRISVSVAISFILIFIVYTSVYTKTSNDLSLSQKQERLNVIVPKGSGDISLARVSTNSQKNINYAKDGINPPTTGTLTDTFAKDFFTLYLKAKQLNKGQPLTKSQTDSLVSKSVAQLNRGVKPTPNFASIKDIKVSGSGPEALRTFANSVGTILKNNISTATTSELVYLGEATQNKSTFALTQLTAIANAYRQSALDVATLSSPKELAIFDTAFINEMMRLSEIVGDFANVGTDPMTAMFALKQYQLSVNALAETLKNMGKVYGNAGVTFLPGSPGESFISVMHIQKNAKAI